MMMKPSTRDRQSLNAFGDVVEGSYGPQDMQWEGYVRSVPLATPLPSAHGPEMV